MAKRNGGIIGPDNVPAGPLGAAGGVWRLEDAFNYQKAGLWPVVLGYQIPNSARFNAGSEDYLTRTPSVAGDRRTWTYSCWVKKVKNDANDPGGYPALLTAGSDGTEFYFLGDTGQLIFYYYNGGYIANVRTSAYLRDISAWYHIVLSIDTTQATDTNRIKIYVNGILQTLTSTTYPAQNTQMDVNNTVGNHIGRYSGGLPYPGRQGNYYLAEAYLIDGQQLTPSSFGETDSTTGIWIPKAYAGTYGTNGFYLKFANSASLGTDSSGNGNNFTVNNLTSVDQSYDSPTNNFSTMNPLRGPTSNFATFTNGNLTIATSTSDPAYYGGRSTMGMSSGKWYFEAKVVSQSSATAVIGIQNTDSYTPELFNGGTGAFAGYSSTGWSYSAYAGEIGNNNSFSSYGNSYTAGDIISVALDCGNAKLYFAKNGTWQNSGVPTSGATGTGAISITSGLTYLFAVDDGGGSSYCTWDCNFGYPPYAANSYSDANGFGNFSYAVPSGYYSLCSKNLAIYG